MQRLKLPVLAAVAAWSVTVLGQTPATGVVVFEGARVIVGDGGALIATWRPGPHHEAFPGVINGGIIGTLLDCHCNWAAAHALMRRRGADRPPCTVTADYAIRMRRPTPTTGEVHLRAWVVEIEDDRATIDSELTAGGEVTATCRGRFVAVKPGHPAYHRW